MERRENWQTVFKTEQQAKQALARLAETVKQEDARPCQVRQWGERLLCCLTETRELVKALAEALPHRVLSVNEAERKQAYAAFCSTALQIESLWQTLWASKTREGKIEEVDWQRESLCVTIAEQYPTLKADSERILRSLEEARELVRAARRVEKELNEALLSFWDGPYKVFFKKAASCVDGENGGRQMRIETLAQLCFGLSVAIGQAERQIRCILQKPVTKPTV